MLRRWKRSLFATGVGIIAFAVFLVVFSFVFVDFVVNLWWFGELGYELYFWQRLLYRYMIFTAVSIIFFLIFFLNFWVASQHLGTTAPPPSKLKPTSLQVYKDLLKMFRTGSMWVYTPLSLILTIPIALPLFRQWESFLLFIFSTRANIQDPFYGKDVTYFLFSFPIYMMVYRRLFLAFSVLLVGVAFLYWLQKRVLAQQDQQMPHGARWHLNILILLIFLIGIWHFVLERHGLLYVTSHERLFFGPGFAEMRVVLPLIWLNLFFLAGTAISLILFIEKRVSYKPLGVFASCFLIALFARYSNFLPEAVQEYVVRPNEITREKPFIENNIKATLTAYNLDHVEIRDFRPGWIPRDVVSEEVRNILLNVPVWDGELLNAVYGQLQTLRTYYNFTDVDVSRYTVGGNYQQVFLAARELNTEQLPPGARNWVNDHLVYTHGYGIVMTPASQTGEEPMIWFVREIPLESELDYNIEQPAIYYGQLDLNYVIAPNDISEFHYPRGDVNVRTHYDGRGGVPVASLFRKLLFAYYFKDPFIFFTTKTNEHSKVLFRRNISERIEAIAPFLMLDNDPYIAATPNGLYWIQDAYLTSGWYPYAEFYNTTEGKRFNYIRNSVKIVVDAYNGTVDFYIFEPEDPIVRAYNRIYPGLLKSREKLPPALMSQVRYPQDIFNIQLAMYAKYHQTDPEVFYKQEDILEFSGIYLGGKEPAVSESPSEFETREPPSIRSYYLTLDMIERHGKFDFLLLAPMNPKGRDNLRVLILAGCDGPNYGRIIVYSFPKGALVYGPSQIYALINQDTRIAQQFTLWDQIGSQVERGKMIMLPIGDVMIYIQPVYLKAATALKIPELKRLIMSQGQIVVMEPSLEDAYQSLLERIRAETERLERRFTPPLPALPTPSPEPDATPGGAPGFEGDPNEDQP